MMKTALTCAVTAMILITATAVPAPAASKTNRVSISYKPPTNSAHQLVYSQMKQRGALERLQEFLSPFLLPETLQIWLDGCDGDPDAFYDYDDIAITICYEYVDDLWGNMPAETTPSGIVPIDTVIGPLFEASLHEVGHALFDILDLPVFGREEDAADQVAAYILLQFSPAEARRLITGTVHAYGTEEKKTSGHRSLEDYAREHSTPGQRAFNLMCIAYGADKELFGDFVSEGYLPGWRAEYCNEEYEQVQYASETLLEPHIDPVLAEKIRAETWLCESQQDSASANCLPLPPK